MDNELNARIIAPESQVSRPFSSSVWLAIWLIAFGLLIFIASMLWIYSLTSRFEPHDSASLSGTHFASIFAISGFIMILFGAEWIRRVDKQRVTARVQGVREELQKPKGSDAEYFLRLANINVENLSAYYFTVKSHANKSFLASLGAGLVGFTLILVGALLNSDSTTKWLAGVSGVLTEFISAVFFYLYSQTVRQMKDYHDSLLDVQNILLSFKLVEDTDDKVARGKMVSSMLEYLVGDQRRRATRGIGPAAPVSKHGTKAIDPPSV